MAFKRGRVVYRVCKNFSILQVEVMADERNGFAEIRTVGETKSELVSSMDLFTSLRFAEIRADLARNK